MINGYYCHHTDYRFLEEIGCYVDSINRDTVVRGCQKHRGLNVNHTVLLSYIMPHVCARIMCTVIMWGC